MNDNATLNKILEKYNVNLLNTNIEMNDIINNFLKNKTDDLPFYIVNLSDIIKMYIKWTILLPNIKPYYAVKCNPSPIILEILASLDCYFDCASKDEINKIIDITKNTNKIIFANPCKMSSHIKYACRNNVNLMTFDCLEELYKIKLYHSKAKLILRLAVDDSKSLCKFNTKFGCKIENLENILSIVNKLELNLVGFSFHVGSGCESAQVYYDAIKICKDSYIIAKKYNINISIIDIGGGFPGSNKEGHISFEEIAEKINKARNEFFYTEINDKMVEFIAEPGRYFVEKSHTLVLNIIAKKNNNNNLNNITFDDLTIKNINDANDIININNNSDINNDIVYYLNDGIYGSFNCMYYDHCIPNIKPLKIFNNDKIYKSKIFGPTCDSMDLIYDNIMLPNLDIGDCLYVENFGAYTIAASSSFNGFLTTEFKYILNC
jgi:ornithine decarboxylase